jgi:hypothetical protein
MWVFKKAQIQRRTAGPTGAIIAAAVTIYDDAAQPQPGESNETFLERSHRTYQYTRALTADGSAFAQTPAQFQAMVKQEVKAHIDQRNAVQTAAGLWEDATGFEV